MDGEAVHGCAPLGGCVRHLTRARVLWSRVYHGHLQREIGEKGNEHLGPVEGVRCVVTGRTSVPEPTWHENVLGIDTGVHIDGRGSGRPAAVSPTRQPPRGTTRAGRYRTLWRGSNDGAVAPIA